MDNALTEIQGLLTVYGLKIAAAIAIFLIGRWVAKLLKSISARMMEKAKLDHTLTAFFSNLVFMAVLVFAGLAALGQLGIETTSFVAVIGAAGLAIALAFQGSLSNIASGFLLIFFRPFKVGDYIEAAGVSGSVKEIHLFTTTLNTPDNKTIIIPNAKLTDDNIINYSMQERRRVDLTVGIGYGDDLLKAKQVLMGLVEAEERILADPAPLVAVSELADSSVNLVVRAWVKTADYWDVYFSLTEQVKLTLDKEGISIPYPQQDVHVVSMAAAANG